MERNVSHTIHDIVETIDRVRGKIAGKTFADFESDWELKFIIQRAIEIISEASRRIPDELKAKRPEIEWRSIANIGNFLRHEYHSISDKVIWDVVQVDLPTSRLPLTQLPQRSTTRRRRRNRRQYDMPTSSSLGGAAQRRRSNPRRHARAWIASALRASQ